MSRWLLLLHGMGQHRGALGLLTHRYLGQSWADLLQPFTVGARVRKTIRLERGRFGVIPDAFQMVFSSHCMPLPCSTVPQHLEVAVPKSHRSLELPCCNCPQKPGFAVRKRQPSSPSPSINGRAVSCSAELIGIGLHRYPQR